MENKLFQSMIILDYINDKIIEELENSPLTYNKKPQDSDESRESLLQVIEDAHHTLHEIAKLSMELGQFIYNYKEYQSK